MLKTLLGAPAIYQAFQEAGGFFNARLKALSEFFVIQPGMRIIDIGCGPGYILEHLPAGIDYIGFDINASYIEHAEKKFGEKGRFFCRFFDDAAAREFALADVVMMNGVLHHISDSDLASTLESVASVLKPDGVLFSLDGCYRSGQSAFRKWMLDNDRGEFVRDELGYRKVLSLHFDSVQLHIREHYSRVPYTFVIGLSSKSQ